MNTELERIEAEALKLSVEERQYLLDRLLASLHLAIESAEAGPAFATPEIEKAWVEECQRRFELMKSGEMATHPADEVMAELMAEYRDGISESSRRDPAAD